MIQRLAVRMFKLYSDVNPWIDLILVINNNGLKGGPEEEDIIRNIYNAWHEDDGCQTIGEYISNRLNAIGWDVSVYSNIES